MSLADYQTIFDSIRITYDEGSAIDSHILRYIDLYKTSPDKFVTENCMYELYWWFGNLHLDMANYYANMIGVNYENSYEKMKKEYPRVMKLLNIMLSDNYQEHVDWYNLDIKTLLSDNRKLHD